MKQLIYPSIMSKNQKELDSDLKHLMGAVKTLHLDIVDGKFAPNHSLDFDFKLSPKFKYEAHLMVKYPGYWIKKHWRQVQIFIPQFEELKDPLRFIHWMKQTRRKVAFALKPETPVSKIKLYLKETDLVLVLTVHPGFYGSKFLPPCLKKVKEIKKVNPKIKVIVDGGINPETIKIAKKSGADYFVSGSFVTKAEKPKERIKNLVKAIIGIRGD